MLGMAAKGKKARTKGAERITEKRMQGNFGTPGPRTSRGKAERERREPRLSAKQGLPADQPESIDCFFAGIGYDARMLQAVVLQQFWIQIVGCCKCDFALEHCLCHVLQTTIRTPSRVFVA